MPPPLLLLLSAFVFGVGLMIVLTKQNVLFILIGIELMFNAACFNFVLFSSYDPQQQGQVFVLLIMAMIVCETAVALAIIFKVYQHYQSIELVQLQRLREE
ncbi:MAG TPA: NADH-quinone oxidoreductase subunit NuoK [Amoebophilaceae bacterium]|nr:NADH-quinone oxidoreductase subunit NuoK [Amoebophilaceae bacterium]